MRKPVLVKYVLLDNPVGQRGLIRGWLTKELRRASAGVVALGSTATGGRYFCMKTKPGATANSGIPVGRAPNGAENHVLQQEGHDLCPNGAH